MIDPRRGVLVWMAGILAAAGCGNAPSGSVDAAPPPGFADDREVIQVVSTNTQGKNVYIPSTIVATAGKGQVLSVYNTTEMPHGFAIDGLGIEEILPPGAEHRIVLPELTGNTVHHVRCHLHPAHRTGTLLVLP